MLSSNARLIIGTIVSFFSGLGIMGLTLNDSSFLTANIDSMIGGIIAIVSLYGFIEHHLHQNQNNSVTVSTSTQPSETVVATT